MTLLKSKSSLWWLSCISKIKAFTMSVIWYLATYGISYLLSLPLPDCSPSTLHPSHSSNTKKSTSGPLYWLFSLLRNVLMTYSLDLGLCSNVISLERRPSMIMTTPSKIILSIPLLGFIFLPSTCHYLTSHTFIHWVSSPLEYKS